MFKLDGNMTFINIDQSYLEKLHDVCSEVYYKQNGYDNKPYIGILINNKYKKYVIPLTSAKEKHKFWKNVDKDCYLIHETADRHDMGQKDIWVALDGDNVKHILAVVDVKKMIPIVDGVYNRVNINPEETDSADILKYKDLLNKEFSFCLKMINSVITKANKIYDKQMKTGKVIKFGCDYKLLEDVSDAYENNEKNYN